MKPRKRNYVTITIVIVLALLCVAPASAKPKPAPAPKPHPAKLKLVVANSSVTNVQACGNPYDMQPDPSVYTTVCIMCPTLPDGPGGETVWVPTLYGVLTEGFDDNIALLGYLYGCDTSSWYYWT